MTGSEASAPDAGRASPIDADVLEPAISAPGPGLGEDGRRRGGRWRPSAAPPAGGDREGGTREDRRGGSASLIPTTPGTLDRIRAPEARAASRDPRPRSVPPRTA